MQDTALSSGRGQSEASLEQCQTTRPETVLGSLTSNQTDIKSTDINLDFSFQINHPVLEEKPFMSQHLSSNISLFKYSFYTALISICSSGINCTHGDTHKNNT